MTNNQTPTFKTHAERLAFFSAAKEQTVPLDHPARRLPPKSRRNSVKHRAIR